MHNNMITIGGQKMAKSLGNYITLEQLYSGDHPVLDQAYSPMTMRFFVLQSHYRSPVDFSNEPLKAAEKGYRRLMNALASARALARPEATAAPARPPAPGATPATPADRELTALVDSAHRQLSDDFNTPQALATLFDLGSRLNALRDGQAPVAGVSKPVLAAVCGSFEALVTEVLGLAEERGQAERLDPVVRILIELRNEARQRRDFATSDRIRDRLKEAGVQLKDGKEGTSYTVE
jgi:cysteinyl-tRNA synthetase